MTFATNERTRRNKRYRVRVTVKVIALSGEVLQGISNDFCETGMALYIPRQFEIGQIVRVEFQTDAAMAWHCET